MTSHNDRSPGFDLRIADWLEADPDRAPSQILEFVRTVVPSISQRHPRRMPRTFPLMSRRAYLAVTIATIAIAGVGLSWYGLFGRSTTGMQPSAAPTAPAAASASAAESISSPGTSAAASAPARPLGGGLIVAHDFENAHDGPLGVFLIDAATGARTKVGQLPGLLGRAYRFQWSPDRAHILVSDALGSSPALQAPTEAAKGYTFICCKELHGAGWWVLSPAGDRIAGVRENEAGDRALEIVILDVDGNGSSRLPLPVGVGANGVSWAPDGTAVVIEGCRPCNDAGFRSPPSQVQREHLFIVPLDGSQVRELLDDTNGGPGAPAWSPDGSSIAVARLTCARGRDMPYCAGDPSFLETVRVADGTTHRLVDMAFVEGEPQWSRDGRRIAFADDTGLFVIGADGNGLVRLFDGDASRVQWSPDGSWLLFRSAFSLWVVPSDGGEPRLVGPYPGAAW